VELRRAHRRPGAHSLRDLPADLPQRRTVLTPPDPLPRQREREGPVAKRREGESAPARSGQLGVDLGSVHGESLGPLLRRATLLPTEVIGSNASPGATSILPMIASLSLPGPPCAALTSFVRPDGRIAWLLGRGRGLRY
jgi:hypothetical protein